MTASTLNGQLIERGALSMPRWGMWLADVQVASGQQLSGAATLSFGGLELKCTILPRGNGNIYRERGWYRVVAGAGGWRKALPAKRYRNGSGVKLSNVLVDAAAECGETMGTIVDRRVGPAYVRLAGEASRSLELLSAQAWHIDNSGVTRLGVRADSTFEAPFQIVDERPDRDALTIAAEDISTLVPGARVVTNAGSVVVSSVRHELSVEGLRSHIWAVSSGPTDRLFDVWRRFVRFFVRETFFHGAYEFRVVSANEGFVDLRPVSASLGLPDLANVEMRSGVAGVTAVPSKGTTVLLGFINGDSTRPFVHGYAGKAAGTYLPESVTVDASGAVYVAGTEPSVQAVAIADRRFVQWGDIAFLPVGAAGTPAPVLLAPDVSNTVMSRARSL